MRTTNRWRAMLIGGGLWLAGATIGGCDQMEPIDQNFDSSLGADFRPPADAAPADGAADGGATDGAEAAAPAAAP